jgi:hypothetical protein
MSESAVDLSTVLSVTTGVHLSKGLWNSVMPFLAFMTRQSLTLFDTAWAVPLCSKELIRQHPFLVEINPPETDADIDDFLALLVEQHGETLTVARFDKAPTPPPDEDDDDYEY